MAAQFCARCGSLMDTWRMSMFNLDRICPDCLKKEQAHPMYQKARALEHEALLRGDYNFEGIGKPDDL